jgi:hypothetical protein
MFNVASVTSMIRAEINQRNPAAGRRTPLTSTD